MLWQWFALVNEACAHGDLHRPVGGEWHGCSGSSWRHGIPSTAIVNVISMDALVVDGQTRPASLPYHGPGPWSTAAGLPTGVGESAAWV